MFTPDTLSRAPLPNKDPAVNELTEAAVAYALGVIADLPATEDKLAEIREQQKKDEVCSLLAKFCANGWPNVNALKGELKLYYKVAGEISVTEGLLLRGNRLIIPQSLRKEMLERLHEGHLGIVKCRARANCSVWSPNLSVQIQEKIERCDICNKEKTNQPEPMLQSESQMVGTDLFEWNRNSYLLVVDYFQVSGIGEIRIDNFKCCHHTLEVNFQPTRYSGQYASKAFKQFFSLITSSPHYPQSNGEAERMVQTIKNLLRKAKDSYERHH